MFERYTERARRVIFFARYEASQFGSSTIEAEHFLLGLLREDKNLIHRFLGSSLPNIRDDITSRIAAREKVSTSIDLPLSEECKRVLAYAAEEAERLGHRHIGCEHLFLGIMREEQCGAAQVLFERGLRVDAVREALARAPMPEEPAAAVPHDLRPLFLMQHHPALPQRGVVTDAETARRIAEAVWSPLFGAETIANQAPPHAELRFNVWLVTGPEAPEGKMFAFILQADGRILSVGRGPAGLE